MQNRWNERDAEQMVDRLADTHTKNLALRLYSARLLGIDPSLVLHGGGNVSLKDKHSTVFGHDVDALFVKRSGADLAHLNADDLPVLDLTALLRLRQLDRLDDAAMLNEFRRCLFMSGAPAPSIETLVHAVIPHRFVDHTHADALLALTNHTDGQRIMTDLLGDSVEVLPYVRPGFDLATAVSGVMPEQLDIQGVVLMQHGLITFADDARESYERHIRIVTACEDFLDSRCKSFSLTPATAPRSPFDSAEALAAMAAPIIRGGIAVQTDDEDNRYRRSILEWRSDEELLRIIHSTEIVTLATSGPLTADHLIRTKAEMLVVDNPSWNDADRLRIQLADAIDAYAQRYRKYADDHGGLPEGADAFPRVFILPGAGLLCWGPSKRDAVIAADIAEHTLRTKVKALALGAYCALSEHHLYDAEFRMLQQAKVQSGRPRTLDGQVVIISGGGGAIGSSIADVCIESGAHVVLADVDESRVSAAVDRLDHEHGMGHAKAVVMDVTNPTSVRDGFAEAVRTFGGVDVVVPNAGVAHAAAIEDLKVDDFKRVMEINATGYLLFMQEGIRILKKQAMGGHIVINASKNVFGPGKDFGAYSASKAAGHQLGKVAAIELAPHGIRVNMINADAVFGNAANPSGLWMEVGPDRAKSRNMKPEELPEYYRQRNLLKVRVTGRHVGNAVVFFAGGATPTTGATLPVDGGVVEAFPR